MLRLLLVIGLFSAHNPAERILIGRLAAHERWAKTEDRSAATAPGRRAALERFDRQVDPEGTLPEAERARRAEHAKRAYFTRLALRSSQARRARKARPSTPDGGGPA